MNKEDFILNARSKRMVENFLLPNKRFSSSLFIGFFNGEKYIDSIEMQLASQNLNEVKIIVVDNASEDRTWEKLQPWKNKFPGQITLVKNPLNVGAAGTLALNIDLFEGAWFATFHQDDFYEREHLNVLSESFQRDGTIDCAFSDMGSMNQERIMVDPPVRPIWLLLDKSPEALFIGNIRTHLIPWPSAGFKTEIFSKNITPWHSAAFADTEIALNLSMSAHIKHLDTTTMHYMENPESESHSLPNPEKYVGAALGLVRILAGADFKHFTEKIEPTSRGEFSNQLKNAIDVRLGTSGLANFVKLFAQEKLNEIWRYSDPTTLLNLSEFYIGLEGERTSKLLHEISEFMSETSVRSFDEIKENAKIEQYEWMSLLTKQGKTIQNGKIIRSTIKSGVMKLLRSIPSKYRKKFNILITKMYIKINPSHPWNFK